MMANKIELRRRTKLITLVTFGQNKAEYVAGYLL